MLARARAVREIMSGDSGNKTASRLAVAVATLATIMTLVFGVASMARDGEVGQPDDEHWMGMRVLLHLAAVIALVAAISAAT
jgi:hypothetical protein